MDEKKNNTRMIIGVVVVLIIIIVGAAYYYSNRGGEESQVEDETPIEAVLPSETQALTARHSFSDGKHIIAGEVKVPTPCDILMTETVVAESFPEQVTAAFKATSSGGICAQVVDTRRFKVEFRASRDAIIKATWNGEPIELKLIESSAPALEAFEVFIKG